MDKDTGCEMWFFTFRSGIVVAISLLVLTLIAIHILGDDAHRIAVTADDAFYVTIPAENYVMYGFPSLDGRNPTNGFHAAIFFFDVFLVWLGIQDICLANQIMGYCFLLLACLALHRYLRRFVDLWTSTFLCLAFVFTPHLFCASLSGLEAPVYVCALVLYYGYLVDVLTTFGSSGNVPLRRCSALGCLAALAYLCRSEFIVHLFSQMMAVLLLVVVRPRIQMPKPRKNMTHLLLVLLPPAIVFVLYGLFGLHETGHFIQSSASQKGVFHALLSDGILALKPQRYFHSFAMYGFLPTVFMLLPLAFLMDERWKKLQAREFVLLVSLMGIHSFYAFFIPIYQWHYMASFITIAFLILPPLLHNEHANRVGIPITGAVLLAVFLSPNASIIRNPLVLRIEIAFVAAYIFAFCFGFRIKSLIRRHALGLLIAAIVSMTGFLTMGEQFRYIHVSRVNIAAALNQVLPNDVVVGAGPAGIYAQYLKNPVVNLDGAISWPALEAIRNGRLHEYVAEQGIDVILEFGPLPGFTLVSHRVQVKSDRHDLSLAIEKALRNVQ